MYRRLRVALISSAISLPAQLLATMVTLVVGTIVALTIVAYRSSLESLEAQARRNVQLVAQTRAQSLVQLLQLRQQRALGFLASVESLCAEPRRQGGFGWSEDCTGTMVREFAAGEDAAGLELLYGRRRIGRYGSLPPAGIPGPDAIAWMPFATSGRADYALRADDALRAQRGELSMTLLFEATEVRRFFEDRSGLGSGGEVFLMDRSGTFLTSARYGLPGRTPTGASVTEARTECWYGDGVVTDIDYRGVRTFHGFTPVPALGGACVEAHIGYDEAVAPAETLRADLVSRGVVFALLGVLVSLLAARVIAAPVRRLVTAAGQLQDGRFETQVPVTGPQEVRELGRALAGMSAELAKLVKGEQAARREAEAANRSKDRFLAMLSHEMRTPLSAILGWTKLLRSGRLAPDKAARALDAVERSAEAQRRLIEDLLDVSRIVAGRLRLVQSPVSLTVVAGAAVEAVRPLAEERGVRLVWEASADDLTVRGDAQRLQQVVWNLAWNAIKFTPEGGTVRVTLAETPHGARLAVSDTGVGIAPEFLPHVFEWYRQDETGAGIPEAGLGLGLALVRQLVDLHHGAVHAESAGEGQGSTFVVTLPLAAHGARPARAEGLSASAFDERISLEGLRVMVVEDDDSTRQVLRAVLEHAGASVTVTGSPDLARAELAARGADVLVSDISMPDEDGYTLMRGLREAGVTVPAIALTSWTRRDDVARAKASGFDRHMAKPLDPERLVQAIAALSRSVSREVVDRAG